MNNSYKTAISIGSNSYSAVNDPLTYCLLDNMDQRFLHGGNSDIYGAHSRPCQLYMAEYCANKWDKFCDVASMNTNYFLPNNIEGYDVNPNMTAGEALIRNTAARRYLTKMSNAVKKYEPFDPTVPTSPIISYWSNPGIPEYAVDPSTIDQDVVMDKILAKPMIASTILINIYNTMKRQGTLSGLARTKLGKFYNTEPYFVKIGGCC